MDHSDCYRWIIVIAADGIWNVTNMAKVRKFEVIFDLLNVGKVLICR
jgi:hypothetical protein